MTMADNKLPENWVPSNDRFEGDAEDFEFLSPPNDEPADPEQAEDEFLKWAAEMDARDAALKKNEQ